MYCWATNKAPAETWSNKELLQEFLKFVQRLEENHPIRKPIKEAITFSVDAIQDDLDDVSINTLWAGIHFLLDSFVDMQRPTQQNGDGSVYKTLDDSHAFYNVRTPIGPYLSRVHSTTLRQRSARTNAAPQKWEEFDNKTIIFMRPKSTGSLKTDSYRRPYKLDHGEAAPSDLFEDIPATDAEHRVDISRAIQVNDAVQENVRLGFDLQVLRQVNAIIDNLQLDQRLEDIEKSAQADRDYFRRQADEQKKALENARHRIEILESNNGLTTIKGKLKLQVDKVQQQVRYNAERIQNLQEELRTIPEQENGTRIEIQRQLQQLEERQYEQSQIQNSITPVIDQLVQNQERTNEKLLEATQRATEQIQELERQIEDQTNEPILKQQSGDELQQATSNLQAINRIAEIEERLVL